MNKEHFWPLWLTKRAKIRTASLNWVQGKAHPNAVVIPLCTESNAHLNSKLEIPVQGIFESIEKNYGFSDHDAELLIRWLWKFEGLAWNASHSGMQARYSPQYTMIDRVLGASMKAHRERFTLAITLIKANDGFADWPVGLDSPLMPHNAIFVSGVFSRLALMSLSVAFEKDVPPQFLCVRLKSKPTFEKEYFPLERFETCSEAVHITRTCSEILAVQHEHQAMAADRNTDLVASRPRVEWP